MFKEQEEKKQNETQKWEKQKESDVKNHKEAAAKKEIEAKQTKQEKNRILANCGNKAALEGLIDQHLNDLRLQSKRA